VGLMSFKTVVYGSIALLVLFVLFSSVVMNYFRSSHTTFGYCRSNSTSLQACSNCNNTATASLGYGRFYDLCYAQVEGRNSTGDTYGTDQNNTHCWGCGNWGFRATARGLFVLIFALALVGFAVAFIRRTM